MLVRSFFRRTSSQQREQEYRQVGGRVTNNRTGTHSMDETYFHQWTTNPNLVTLKRLNVNGTNDDTATQRSRMHRQNTLLPPLRTTGQARILALILCTKPIFINGRQTPAWLL